MHYSAGVRREELLDASQDDERTSELRRVVFCFFDSEENVPPNKGHLFRNPDLLDKFVLANFHGYFEELKGLVKEWFHLLVCFGARIPWLRIS